MFFALASGWPGLGLGAACGAVLWRSHRFWGALAGALVGAGLCLGFFFWWVDTPVSTSLDYFGALARAALLSLPAVMVGAAIGARAWRARRIAGAVAGGLAGAAIGFAVFVATNGRL